MNTLNYQKATFLKSVSSLSQLPEDIGKEIAFAGYSNVGKSSALNALTRQRHLARTSKTPGRTQCINFFSLNDKYHLVDLPGYGYAKVPQALKDNWLKLLDQYLRSRQSLCGLVLLMDIRHPLKDFEVKMLTWTAQVGLPTHVLLTKADKLSKNAQQTVLRQIQTSLKEKEQESTVSLFSVKQNIGLEILQNKLNDWFE